MSGLDEPHDEPLDQVFKFIKNFPKFGEVIGLAIRQAIDDVIEGPRTDRWSIAALDKVEKTYIGTRVEILVRNALGVPRGRVLDYLIEGHEVDAKFSIYHGKWMIPQEAVGEICLLLSANDEELTFNVGVVRADITILTAGQNQDKKRSISAVGRSNIRRLIDVGQLPKNFLMHEISVSDRIEIFREPAGQARVNTLFRLLPNKPIPAEVISALASHPQHMATYAAYESKRMTGFTILSGHVVNEVMEARKFGVELRPGYFMRTEADDANIRPMVG